MTTTSAEIEFSHEFARFARVMHVMKSQMAGLLPAGLDPAAAQLLAWLVKEGPHRQNELAGFTFLDPSTVSRRVSQLVSHGLTERRADPADGRAVQLVPTRAGIELFGVLRAHREHLLHQVLSDWPAPDIAELGRLMSKFSNGIEAMSTTNREGSEPHE